MENVQRIMINLHKYNIQTPNGILLVFFFFYRYNKDSICPILNLAKMYQFGLYVKIYIIKQDNKHI